MLRFRVRRARRCAQPAAFIYAGVPIVRLAKQMALTRKPPIPYDSMLLVTRMIEAARLAHNKVKRVYIKDIR